MGSSAGPSTSTGSGLSGVLGSREPAQLAEAGATKQAMKRLWLGRCWTGAWRDLAHRPLVLTAELQRLEARQASVQFGAPIRLSPVADRALVAVWWVSPRATVELPTCGKLAKRVRNVCEVEWPRSHLPSTRSCVVFGTVQQNCSSECIHLGGAAVPQRQHCQRSARSMADVEKMDVEVRLRLADVLRIAGPPRRPWIPRPSRESPASSPAAWVAPTILACPGGRWGLHTCDEEPCARCEHRWTRRVPTSKARAASQGRGELQTQAQGGGVCEGQRGKGGVRRCP